MIISKKIAEFEHRGNVEHYYFSENYSGEIKLVGDGIFNSNIVDKEEWISIHSLYRINLFPKKIKIVLIDLFINN